MCYLSCLHDSPTRLPDYLRHPKPDTQAAASQHRCILSSHHAPPLRYFLAVLFVEEAVGRASESTRGPAYTTSRREYTTCRQPSYRLPRSIETLAFVMLAKTTLALVESGVQLAYIYAVLRLLGASARAWKRHMREQAHNLFLYLARKDVRVDVWAIIYRCSHNGGERVALS